MEPQLARDRGLLEQRARDLEHRHRLVGLDHGVTARRFREVRFAETAAGFDTAHDRGVASAVIGSGSGGTTPAFVVALAWAAVLIPLLWGVYRTLLSAAKVFS